MTLDELQNLGEAMNHRWPGKYGESDLIPWFREMAKFMLVDVIESLDAFKQAHAFPPKIPEILGLLKAAGIRPQTVARPRRKSALAESIIVTNPHLADKSDPELVTAHHRHLFSQFTSAVFDWRDAMPQARTRLAAERIEAVRFKAIRECTSDLVAVGVPCERAAEIAAAVVAGEAEYWAIMATLCEAIIA